MNKVFLFSNGGTDVYMDANKYKWRNQKVTYREAQLIGMLFRQFQEINKLKDDTRQN